MDFLRTFRSKLKFKPRNKGLVRKEDDEVRRYLKQNRLTTTRREFNQRLQQDLQDEADGLNTQSIRLQHYKDSLTLEQTFYNKSFINDHEMDFSHLHDPRTFRPLAQKFRLFPFYVYPSYSKGAWRKDTPFKVYLVRVLGCIVLVKVGYELGLTDSVNEGFERSTVVPYECEEQIFHYLFNMNKTGVFLQFYVPGHTYDEIFNKAFEEESYKYTFSKRPQRPLTLGEKLGIKQRKDEAGKFCKSEEDDIVFMRVNCRKHLNFCQNKMWEDRVAPAAEIYFINEQDKIELVDMDNRHRSAQGIESFFRMNQLLDEKFNPDQLLERAADKYLQII